MGHTEVPDCRNVIFAKATAPGVMSNMKYIYIASLQVLKMKHRNNKIKLKISEGKLKLS